MRAVKRNNSAATILGEQASQSRISNPTFHPLQHFYSILLYFLFFLQNVKYSSNSFKPNPTQPDNPFLFQSQFHSNLVPTKFQQTQTLLTFHSNLVLHLLIKRGSPFNLLKTLGLINPSQSHQDGADTTLLLSTSTKCLFSQNCFSIFSSQ